VAVLLSLSNPSLLEGVTALVDKSLVPGPACRRCRWAIVDALKSICHCARAVRSMWNRYVRRSPRQGTCTRRHWSPECEISSWSCSATGRERLPEAIVVDGGPEFESLYFETLLARYGCTRKMRPGGRLRFGSVCERLFGTINTRFVHTLAGNTQLTQNRGKVTKSVNPKGQACWTLAALAAGVCEWAYEVYDALEHPALGQSPREAHAAGLQISGRRPQRHIAYDEDFGMVTLPTTQKRTAKLRPGRGIKVNYLYYWSDALLNPDVEGTQVPVRYDPFDAGLVYAFIRRRWVRSISEHHAQFAGRSERKIQLANAELHRRHQRHNQQFRITARQLADFPASVEGEEVVLEQCFRDAEARITLKPPVGTPLMDPVVVAVLGADDSVEPDLEFYEALCPALTGASSHDPLVIYHDY
jgi:transposase InsO family protein